MGTERNPETMVFRPIPILRWTFGPGSVLVGGFTVLSSLSWGGADALVALGLGLFMIALGSIITFHVRLELRPDHLVIWNLLPQEVAYREIVAVETPPFRDLVIRTETRNYRSFALAKDNISRLLGKRTQADRVVEEILRRAALAREN